MNGSYLLITLIIIIAAIVVYIVLYNINANRALKTGRAKTLIDKGPLIQLFLSISILVLSVFMIFQISKIKTNISNLESNTYELQNKINILNARIANLEALLNDFIQSDSNIYNLDYKFVSGDVDNETIGLSFSFSLKEQHPTSVTKLIAINTLNGKKDEYDLSSNYGVITDVIYLDIKGSYDITIIDVQSNLILTYPLLKGINLSEEINTMYKSYVEHIREDKVKMVKIYVSYWNKYNLEELNLKHIYINIYDVKTSKVVEKIDIIDYLITNSTYEYLITNKYNDDEKYYYEVSVVNSYGEIKLK